MNSVERLQYYTEELPQEASEITDVRPPAEWPQEGKIEFKDVVLKYRPDLPAVLQSLNLSIASNQKIGIVGRTGAGKSTIMIALFRLVEISEGTISIDGVDISKIGLKDLRSKLAIIPQDPVLYSGTVRSNIDPFNEHDESDLWLVLERSHLKSYISSIPEKLDAPVFANGSNFSVGQRQLLCLARAMLRKAKILVMDEATANIDVQTDALIQKVIRDDFMKCTILTIAHRLNTVIDYDKILVLDHGKAVEFDVPHLLLSNPTSTLLSMVNETGANNAELLRKQAEEAFKKE
jgi:ABC-type multidrug transport system fused ATPase/permease subunit